MSTARTSATSRDGGIGAASERYARPMIALHWLIAIAIIAMLCIGFYMVGLPRGLPFKSDLINFHKSLGITVFLLVLIRILVRLAYGRPPLPPMRTWQRAAASITQALLYAGMVAMPLTGYLGCRSTSSARSSGASRCRNGAGTTSSCGRSFSASTNISRGSWPRWSSCIFSAR